MTIIKMKSVKDVAGQMQQMMQTSLVKDLQINGVGQKPRVGQTFTSAHDRANTYTVTSVGPSS